MVRFVRVSVAVIVVIPLLLQGQEAFPVSLSESIRIALANNPSIQISRSRVEDASLSRREAWGAFMPQIDARSSTILDEKIRIIEMPSFLDPTQTTRLKLDFTYDYQADFSITQPIFTGGKLTRGVQLGSACHQ